MHLIKHAADGERSKGREQNTMCFAPIWLIIVSRKEAIVNALSNSTQDRLERLLKPLFVTEFVDKGIG